MDVVQAAGGDGELQLLRGGKKRETGEGENGKGILKIFFPARTTVRQ